MRLCYINEPWMSIGVFLIEWIFRHGYFHGPCMGTSIRGVGLKSTNVCCLSFLQNRSIRKTGNGSHVSQEYRRCMGRTWRTVVNPSAPADEGKGRKRHVLLCSPRLCASRPFQVTKSHFNLGKFPCRDCGWWC